MSCISLYPSWCVKILFLCLKSAQQCKHCLIMCHVTLNTGQLPEMFQTHPPTCTPSHSHLPVSWGLPLNEVPACLRPLCPRTLPVYMQISCFGNLGLKVTWLLLWVWRCIFLSSALPIFFFLLIGEMLQIHRSLHIWKLWTPGFLLLDYLWIYLRVPHLLSRLQLWAFLTSKELLRAQWRNLGLSLQKSSMSARPRSLSWSCGCTKPTWHSSRKH